MDKLELIPAPAVEQFILVNRVLTRNHVLFDKRESEFNGCFNL